LSTVVVIVLYGAKNYVNRVYLYVTLIHRPFVHVYRWSTADGKIFKDDLEQAATPLPEGWEVSLI
jgi:hypothetical protein